MCCGVVVCCWLLVVVGCWSLFVVRCWLFGFCTAVVDCCFCVLSFFVRLALFVVRCLLFVVCRALLPSVDGWLSFVGG